MPASVIIRIDPEGVAKFAHSPDGELARFMYERMSVVQAAAVRQCPKRTNKLSESIVKRWHPTLEGQAIELVAAQPYAYFVHEGTGIYGARHARIYPKTASVLSWVSNGQRVFAKSVKGIKPNHFLSDNLPLFFEA